MAKSAIACLLAVLLSAAANVSAQTVRVDPPGWMGEGPMDPVDFGEVAVGECISITFNVVSVGPTPLAVHHVELLDDAQGAFSITSIVDPIPPELLVGEWIEVELTYAPLELGTHTATLRIDSNDHAVRFLDGPLTGTAVPEPATMSLLALGGLALIRRRRRTA